MEKVVSATIGRVIYAHFEPDEDVYRGLVEVIQRERLHTGVILSITGAVRIGRLSLPRRPEATHESPGFVEFEGLSEVQGNGYFGYTQETWLNERSQIRHDAGEPFLHCHMSVSCGGETFMGHLIEGCKVRSLHPHSHFVAVLAETHGAQLTFHCSEEKTEQYPYGLPYYQLVDTTISAEFS